MYVVKHYLSTVYNWAYKADTQPDVGRSPDHVAVDGTVIRLNNKLYWLYAAVDPDTNESLHTKSKLTRIYIISWLFLQKSLKTQY